MAVKSRYRGRINQPLIIISGIVLLVSSIFIYLFILRGVYGRIDSSELIPNSKLIKNAIYGKEANVCILYSQYTENMLPEGSTWLNDNINTWKKLLSIDKYKYDVISDSTIELGKLFKYQLLILPGSKSLSDKEIVQIKKFLVDGGSVFATSGTASYSDDGKWRGWDFLSQTFGIKFTKEISPDEFTKIHTLRGGLPITANIPAGFSLKVATWDRPMAVEVLDPRTIQASFWYNYRLQKGLTREQIKNSAGIVYGSYGSGRFIWMGFDINSIIGVQEDYVYFDKLFHNCMDWLTYKPIAFIKNWPANYNAAAILVSMLSENIENENNLFPILKSENVPATFFINSSKAENYKNIVKMLPRYGDIGAIVNIRHLSSSNDSLNVLNDFNTQLLKFKKAKTTLDYLTNSSVSGGIPYYGTYDHNTLQSLIKDGYKYIFADSLTDRSVPKTIVLDDSLIIAIPKTARDDYEVIRDFGLTDTTYQYFTYQEDEDRVLFEGGLYTFKFHTDYQCKPKYVNVIRKVIDDLKKKKFWITTASQVEKWWAKRNYVEVRANQRGEYRVALTVSNPGEQIVNGLVVQIDMNEPISDIALSTELVGTKTAKYVYDKNSEIIYVYLNDLHSDESRTYFFDYNKQDN